MKTTLLMCLGIFLCARCSISSDTEISSQTSDELLDENLYSIAKLSEEEILQIKQEIELDTAVSFPEPLDLAIDSPYNGSVQLLYHHQRNGIEYFIKTILVAEISIKDIRYTDGKITFNVYSNDSINYYEEARNMSFSWRYYYAHDIYGSFFSYDEIDTVEVLMEGEPDTWLPTSGDTDGLHPPSGYMLKRWYIPSFNYIGEEAINIDDESYFEDFENYVVKESVLDSLSRNY